MIQMHGLIKAIPRCRYTALCSLILAANFVWAQPMKVSKDLQRLPASQWVNVIVQYRVSPNQKHFKRVVAKGGSLRENLPLINGGAFTIKAGSLATLANEPDVAYISPDRTVRATAIATDFYDQAVLAPYAWSQGLNGSGIGVAVIDSGIASNKDFSLSPGKGSRIVYSKSFVSGQTSASDTYGHGTHVAGIIAGNGMNSSGKSFTKKFEGIAYNANLIN